MDVVIPTNLVCVLFDPAIPTSSFNYIVFMLVIYIYYMQGLGAVRSHL